MKGVASLEQALRDARATLGDGRASSRHDDGGTLRRIRKRARGVVTVADDRRARDRRGRHSFLRRRTRLHRARRDRRRMSTPIASANWRASAELRRAPSRRGAVHRHRIDDDGPHADLRRACRGARGERRRTPRLWRTRLRRIFARRASGLCGACAGRRTLDAARQRDLRVDGRRATRARRSPRRRNATPIFRRRRTGGRRRLRLRAHGLRVLPGVTPPN